MFSKLKSGFIPHGSVSTKSECDSVRYETVKLSSMISSEVRTHGVSSFPQINFDSNSEDKDDGIDEIRSSAVMGKTTVAALAEVVLTETIYYHQLGEIGCFLATAFSEEEEKNQKQKGPPQPDQCDGDCDCFDSDCDFNCENEEQKPQSILAANLLIASGRVRKTVMELTDMLDISYTLLGPAGYVTDPHNAQSIRNMYGLLLSLVYTRLGGRSYDADNGDTMLNLRRGVLSKLCEISQDAWTLMNLCGMLQTFRLRPSIGSSPLFDTVLVTPTESVFGNNGWRPVLQAAVMRMPSMSSSAESSVTTAVTDSVPTGHELSVEEFENDDVPSVVPPGYAPKRMKEFDNDDENDDVPCYD